MLVYISRSFLQTATHVVPQVSRVAAKGCAAQFVTRFLNTTHYAVDAPDGEHDFEDVEEHMEGVKRIIDFASISEDASSINMEHDVVKIGKPIFAVDAPDGEHDFEDLEEHMDGVTRIIAAAHLFENPDKVRTQQQLRQETYKEANKMAQNDF